MNGGGRAKILQLLLSLEPENRIYDFWSHNDEFLLLACDGLLTSSDHRMLCLGTPELIAIKEASCAF
jgi:hypothetical protein